MTHSEQYTENQINEFRETFKLFDKEGKGWVTTDEISKIINFFGVPMSDTGIKELVSSYDDNSNGHLDFHEFLEMMAANNVKLHNMDECHIREAFKAFDKDQNGLIDAEELLQVMENLGQKLSESEVNDMIKEGDLDHDGKINYNEFLLLMNSS